ncbi:MAG TPA: hypothetical protein VIH05_11285 [Tepidiformaceae bacterium]
MKGRISFVVALAVAVLVASCGAEDEALPPEGAATVAQAPVEAPARPDRLGTYTGIETRTIAPDFEALPGARAEFGVIGKAGYRIEVPEEWNGDLVLWAHGFRGFGPELTVSSPPSALRQAIIESGAAWAASSYSENGYAPGIGVDDTLALKEHFEAEYGEVKRTYIGGVSMGGHVVALALEYYPDEFDGALSICGTLGGQEQQDYLVSWAAVASFLAGVDVPVGRGANAASVVLLTRISPALGSVEEPTAQGLQFRNVMQNLTGGPRPFFNEGFREQFAVNFGLLLADPNRQTVTGAAATNEGVTYEVADGLGIDSETINEGVERLAANPSARDAETHPDAVPTSGRIATPLLALHNTGDLFVPISHMQSYRRKVDQAGAGDLFVERAIRAAGHCKFSAEELRTAYGDLLAWVEDGKKPEGDDLTGDLSDIGRRFTNPLRPGDPGNQ